MAKTKGTNPYSGSLGEPRCSGRNQKPVDETGGVCKSRKKVVPKRQRKDLPELHTCLNAQAQVLHKDQELLGRDSAAALEHHQPMVGDPPTHPDAPAQLQRKDQEFLSESPPRTGMPTLIRAAAAVGKTPESHRRYPIRPNYSAFHTPPKKILARLKEDNVTDISPYDHKTPPPSLQLSVDMVSYAQTAIVGHNSEYDKQEHLTENNGDDNVDKSSELDDNDRDGDYKQRDSSDDDNDLNLAVCKREIPNSLFDYSDNDFDHLLDNKDLDEDVKRIEYANSRKRESLGRWKGTILEGGPQEPSYKGMTAAKERAAREEYQMLRKKLRDQTRSDRLHTQKTTKFNDGDFTGNLCPTLRPMSDVCAAHLERGHSFPDRDLVLLCASEEANFCGIHYTVKKSKNRQLICIGPGFKIYALHSVKKGWIVTRCEICETESAGATQPNIHQHSSCSPYQTNMIVPLIATTVAKMPMVPNMRMRKILEPYRKAYCFTDNILQNAQTKARKLIFGVPEENVGYASFVKNELEKLGHFVMLSFTNRKETIQNVEKILIADEVCRRKEAHLDELAPNKRRAFVSKWMNKNSKFWVKQLGWKSNNASFLDRVLFAPSFVKRTVPHLQKFYMADACHLNFGKYT
jgi:hypothetical protein